MDSVVHLSEIFIVLIDSTSTGWILLAGFTWSEWESWIVCGIHGNGRRQSEPPGRDERRTAPELFTVSTRPNDSGYSDDK
ncbi:hypothetical protein OJAV_G00132650 [Oryzias javanicus]|uniref:Uncharacterized protein n=1 Tax=Oryzias javanicus TaxID=123683 RepID=A0A437CQY9_ORYJA|nr:hypothetical protein OJAV_G00132650 [Oryzias javanicus]